MTREQSTRGAGFWIAVVIGWAMIAYGAWLAFGIRGGARTAGEIAAWVAGGHVAHDAVLVPAALLVGAALGAVLVPWLRGPVRAGLLATACVLAVAYPALRGFGAKPRNPSVLPLDYDRAVLTVLAVVWAGVAVVTVARVVRRRRARGAPTSDATVAAPP